MSTERNDAGTRLGIAAAITAGLGAAACCLGPLVFAVLGIAGGGFLVKFEAYRPYFIAAAAVALGAGFWYAYRTPGLAAGGEAAAECDCEMPRANRLGRAMLWVAAVVVAGLIASPYLIAWAGSSAHAASPVAAPKGELATVTIPVEGMDCAGCEVTIRAALRKIPGVVEASADAAAGRAVVRYRPAEVSLDRLVEAINDTGYTAGAPRQGS